MTKKAFSLIELLVVIAIIAILAAIAVPQYQNYMARVKTVAGLKMLYAYNDAIWRYVEQGQAITTLTQIGINPAVINTPTNALQTVTPASVNNYLVPYLAWISASIAANPPSPACPQMQIGGAISNIDNNTPLTTGGGSYLYIVMYTFAAKNKAKDMICYYFDTGSFGRSVPGCYNSADTNQMNAFNALYNTYTNSC